jgi:hypothetical protein
MGDAEEAEEAEEAVMAKPEQVQVLESLSEAYWHNAVVHAAMYRMVTQDLEPVPVLIELVKRLVNDVDSLQKQMILSLQKWID